MSDTPGRRFDTAEAERRAADVIESIPELAQLPATVRATLASRIVLDSNAAWAEGFSAASDSWRRISAEVRRGWCP